MSNCLAAMVPHDHLKLSLLNKCNPKLMEILSKLYWFCQDNFPSPKGARFPQVTCAHRTLAEQKALDDSIIAQDPNYKAQGAGSLHVFGNAMDLSVRDQFGTPFDSRDINKIISFVDSVCPYNFKDIPACYRHVGSADHLHVQINIRQWGQGTSPA